MIWLVQLLCPERHCIIAAAYDDKTGETFPHVQELLKARLAEIHADPWCGICGSWDLHFEQRQTKFPDIATAYPILKLAEASNLQTRQHFQNLKKQ